MKKLIPVLVAALVLMLASPVFAAEVKLTGSVSGKTGYEGGLFHEGGATLGAEAQITDNIKAAIGLNFTNGLTDTIQNGMSWSDFAAMVDKAYIETNGALVTGLPSMTTRLGTQEIGYSIFNAHDIKGEGIGIRNLAIGPVALAGFQSWNSAEQVRGGQISVNPLEGLSVSANVIHAGADDTQQLSAAVEGSVTPIDPLTINAAMGYMHDADDPAFAFAGGAEYQVLPYLGLHAGARKIDTNYAPRYMYSKLSNNEIGFNGGVTVNAFGATLDTNVDYAKAIEVIGEMDEVVYTGEMSLERPFSVAGMNFTPAYALSLSKADEGEIGITEHVLSLGYEAPNSLNITGGVDITDLEDIKPFVNAAMKVEF